MKTLGRVYMKLARPPSAHPRPRCREAWHECLLGGPGPTEPVDLLNTVIPYPQAPDGASVPARTSPRGRPSQPAS